MMVAGDGREVRVTGFGGVVEPTLNGRKFFLLLAIYFGLHVLTRSLVSSNLQLDEAEQFVVNQTWRLGYGSQPPLYDWIQHGLFEALGASVFALSLLKNAALFGAYAFTYLAAAEILFNGELAILATAALLFFPQIAWESQRDQSHLVLATTCAAATLFVYVRLLKTNAAKWYALFGVAVALGFLAKYNYLLLPVSLISATLLTRNFRRAVLTPRILITAMAFVTLAVPHILWMIGHRAEVASQSYKFALTGALAPKSAFAGVFQLTKAFAGMAIVPLLIFVPLLVKARGTKFWQADSFLPLLLKTFLAGFTILLLLVLAEHVTFLRDRWIQPLLFALPILIVGVVREKLTAIGVRSLLTLSALVAVTVLIAINLTVVGASVLNRAHNLNVPYAPLAAELRASGFQFGPIVADGAFLGGNLKKQFPESRVIIPELQDMTPAERPALIIWSARREEVPEDFLRFAARASGVGTNDFRMRHLEIGCRNGRRRSERFGYIILR